MKTQSTNPPPARIISTAASLLGVALLFAGCVVTAVYPYYTEKDLVFDPALVGDWMDGGRTNASSEFIRIERAGENSYWATPLGLSETNRCELHLFHLRQQLFVDSCPTNRSLDFVPVHQVSKVVWRDSALATADLNYDWLAKLIEKNPKAIRHLILHENPEDLQSGRVVLTAETPELQRFILKYANNTNAWNGATLWKRRN